MGWESKPIAEMAWSMIHAQCLGHEFWVEAVCNEMYIRKQCPTKAIKGKTPEEMWSGRMLHISHMRMFSCVAYVKVVKCLFFGYCRGTKVYWLICLEMKKIIQSPDMMFLKKKHIWRIIHVRELMKHPWSGKIYPPNWMWKTWRKMATFKKPTRSLTSRKKQGQRFGHKIHS